MIYFSYLYKKREKKASTSLIISCSTDKLEQSAVISLIVQTLACKFKLEEMFDKILNRYRLYFNIIPQEFNLTPVKFESL